MQYNTLNLMYVYEKKILDVLLQIPFNAGTQNRQSLLPILLRNLGCAPKGSMEIGHGKCK